MRMKLSYEALKREISEHKGSFAVYLLLRGFVVLTLILPPGPKGFNIGDIPPSI